jgi:shikimate dehydrogenase
MQKYIGLVGGRNISQYSVADVVWKEILKIGGKHANFVYFPIEKASNFRKFIYDKFLHDDNFIGINVAFPWKSEAARIAHEKSLIVEKTGVANCLYVKNRKICADNTDGLGCLESLKNKRIKSIFVIGVGGAGTAVIYEAFQKGIDVYVWDIDRNKLRKLNRLVKTWGDSGQIHVLNPKKILNSLRCDVIINATTVGKMWNKNKRTKRIKKSPISIDTLKKVAKKSFVLEMNYLPKETELLIQAKRNNNRTIPGLHMLVNQAILSYTHYFSQPFPPNKTRIVLNKLDHILYDKRKFSIF